MENFDSFSMTTQNFNKIVATLENKGATKMVRGRKTVISFNNRIIMTGTILSTDKDFAKVIAERGLLKMSFTEV